VDRESQFSTQLNEAAMIWKRIIPLIAAVSILGLAACGGDGAATPSEGVIQTAIAQTDTAQKNMEIALNATLTAMGKGAAQETLSPAMETLATATLTSAPPTVTPTSGPVMVSVSADTWCSKGPALIYDKVFVFKVGQTAKVIGREEFNNYWVIEKPDNPAITCWLWGKYATLTGDPSALPVIAPPPTPTPSAGLVTAVSITVAHAKIISNVNITCPFEQPWTVTVTTNGPTTVEYAIMFYGGVGNYDTSYYEMVFNSAGMQSYGGTYHDNGCSPWKFKIFTTSPNNMEAIAHFEVVK
jgi:hypothetical protein